MTLTIYIIIMLMSTIETVCSNDDLSPNFNKKNNNHKMARIQRELVIERPELKEKYLNEGNRSAMCKAIGGYTPQCNIDVRAVPKGVRFEVIGPKSGVNKVLKDIKQVFCQPTGDAKTRSRKVFRCMKKQDQIKILEGVNDPGQPLLTEAILRQHNLLHEVRELREFACLPCKHFWWRSVLIMKPVSTCNNCHKRYDALPRDKVFGIGRYICQNKHTFFKFCHATLSCRCMKCYEMVSHPYIHPEYLNRRKLKIRKPVDPDTELFDPTEEEPHQKKAAGDDVSPYEHKKKKKYIFNPSTAHVSTGSTKMTFLTQAGSSDFGDDESTVTSSGGDSPYSSSDNGSDSDSTLDQSDDDFVREGSLTTMHPSNSDLESEYDTSSNHPTRKRELGTYSCDYSSENDDKTPEPSETGSADSEKLSSQVSTIQDSGIGTASNIDTVSTAGSANNTADSAKNTAVTVHTTSHDWERSSTIKPDYLPVRFSRREFQKSVDHHGADIIGEGIHVTIPPNAICQGNKVSVTVQACLEGPFEFPSDYEPISPVYLLHPPYIFQTYVELKIKVFADIKDSDEIIFLTSRDKPLVRKKQNVWIFVEEIDDVFAKPYSGGCPAVSVSVRHFCFGLLARRRRKRRKDLYVVCLYTLLPSCRAIFTASLDSDVYMHDFEDYLQKKFKEDSCNGEPRHTRLSANEIELVLPTSTEVEVVLDSSPCIIKQEFLDLPKRKKNGTSSHYPPRIAMSIRGTSEQHQVCTFGVIGTEEKIEFNVKVPGSPFRPPSLSTHSSRSEASDGPTYQSIVDHVGVSEAVLKRQCSREHLRKIAVLVPNWRELAINLGVQEGYIMDINSNQQLTGPVMKAHSVLYQWHRANGFMASYEILIGALQGDAVLAERVCRIAKELEAELEVE